MRKNIYRILACFVFAVLIHGICEAGVKKDVQFPRGSTTTMIEQSVIRGERDLYYLTAKAGQTMDVSISALEKNAVFQIYKPGSKIAMEDGIQEVKGETLPGVGEEDDATAWNGVLPVSGKYLIVVGGTRGNATYKLKIGIH